MRVEVTGTLQAGATAKDLALTVIATIGFRGGTGYVLEYTGSAIRALTMEQRMTLCNMAIEAGATTGMIAADATTAAYLAAIPNAPDAFVYDGAGNLVGVKGNYGGDGGFDARACLGLNH